MRKIHGIIAAVLGMVLLTGSWMPAHAQAGDCYGTSGCLDTSFGGSGKVVTRINNNSYAAGIAIEPVTVTQTDGSTTIVNKIVAAVQAYPNGNAVFAVARYNVSDGNLDGSFGQNGVAVTNVAGYVQGIAVQSDGKIVVAGFGGVIVLRFNTDGSLDSTFGTGGVVNIPSTRTASSAAYAVAIQDNGYIVVAGAANGMGAWRFKPDGTSDSAFGSGGTASVTFGTGTASKALTMTLQTVGTEQRIVLGGESGSSRKSGNSDFALARLTKAGQLDTSFGSAGKMTRDFAGYNDLIRGLAVDSSNRILAAGSANLTGTSGGTQFALARYTPNGVPDYSFGTNGAATLRLLSGDNTARVVAVQSDGEIVVAGIAYSYSSGPAYMAVARFWSDVGVAGMLDTSFGSSHGFTTSGFSSFSAVGADAFGLLLQPDGKIVLGGEAELTNSTGGSTSEVALARYLP